MAFVSGSNADRHGVPVNVGKICKPMRRRNLFAVRQNGPCFVGAQLKEVDAYNKIPKDVEKQAMMIQKAEKEFVDEQVKHTFDGLGSLSAGPGSNVRPYSDGLMTRFTLVKKGDPRLKGGKADVWDFPPREAPKIEPGSPGTPESPASANDVVVKKLTADDLKTLYTRKMQEYAPKDKNIISAEQVTLQKAYSDVLGINSYKFLNDIRAKDLKGSTMVMELKSKVLSNEVPVDHSMLAKIDNQIYVTNLPGDIQLVPSIGPNARIAQATDKVRVFSETVEGLHEDIAHGSRGESPVSQAGRDLQTAWQNLDKANDGWIEQTGRAEDQLARISGLQPAQMRGIFQDILARTAASTERLPGWQLGAFRYNGLVIKAEGGRIIIKDTPVPKNVKIALVGGGVGMVAGITYQVVKNNQT